MARKARPAQRFSRSMGVPLAAALAPSLAKPAAKRGFREARLVVEWPDIVGPELAQRTRPRRLERRGGLGILHLVVSPGWNTEVQHLAPVMAERINAYYGTRTVDRLVIKQGEVAARPRPPAAPKTGALSPPPAMSESAAAHLDAACAAVEDPELAQILRRLGSTIAQRREQRR